MPTTALHQGAAKRCTTPDRAGAAGPVARCSPGRGSGGANTAMPSAVPLGFCVPRSCTSGARKTGCDLVTSDDSKRVVCTVGTRGERVTGIAGSEGQRVSSSCCAPPKWPAAERSGPALSSRRHRPGTGYSPTSDRFIRAISSRNRRRTGCSRSRISVQRPMKVIGDVRDFLVNGVGRVRHGSPGRPPATSTVNPCWQAGHVTAARVWPSWFTRR